MQSITRKQQPLAARCSAGAIVAIVSSALLIGINSSQAALISEDFEGSFLGSTTPPTGWALNHVAGTSSYETSLGKDDLGLGGQITGNHPSNGSTLPAGYVVNSDGIAFDATKPISGSFDFWIEEAGNYSSGIFMFGDIQNGIAQNDAGEFLGLFLRERTFGARAAITDGAGATLATDSANRIESQYWITSDFVWTPTSGTTGDLSFSVEAHASNSAWTETVTGYTFNTKDAFFGFGTGGYFSGEHTLRIDNISITGTEVPSGIPEPATAALGLLALAGLGVTTRRRRA